MHSSGFFYEHKSIKNTYALVDFPNRRFLTINYWKKTAYTLPLTSCSNLTQYTILKRDHNTWIIATEIAHSTYVLSSSLSFNQIFTGIDLYVPNFNQKCVLTLTTSNNTSFKEFFKLSDTVFFPRAIQLIKLHKLQWYALLYRFLICLHYII